MKFPAIVVLSGLLVVSASQAAEPVQAMAQASKQAVAVDPFMNFDRDGDALVSNEELRNAMAMTFMSLDKNSDGWLKGDEIPAATGPDGAKLTPMDRKVEDFIGSSDEAFMLADKDQDGYLSRDELRMPKPASVNK